jgi:hypothetical protein
MKKDKTYLDENSWPTRVGVYLVVIPDGEEKEIDVYRHRVKGLCCFAEDFGSSGSGVDDRYDCHVSVQNTGLKFIRRLRRLS